MSPQKKKDLTFDELAHGSSRSIIAAYLKILRIVSAIQKAALKREVLLNVAA
jgi:hypothetical protein